MDFVDRHRDDAFESDEAAFDPSPVLDRDHVSDLRSDNGRNEWMDVWADE